METLAVVDFVSLQHRRSHNCARGERKALTAQPRTYRKRPRIMHHRPRPRDPPPPRRAVVNSHLQPVPGRGQRYHALIGPNPAQHVAPLHTGGGCATRRFTLIPSAAAVSLPLGPPGLRADLEHCSGRETPRVAEDPGQHEPHHPRLEHGRSGG